jgi:hypothetical protein
MVTGNESGILTVVNMETGTSIELQGTALGLEYGTTMVTPTAVIFLAEGAIMSTPLTGDEPTLIAPKALWLFALTPDFTKVLGSTSTPDRTKPTIMTST